MTLSTPSRRRSRLAVTGIALGAVLAVGAPLAASAHVHVTPESALAGATTSVAFSFSHGCEESPTTALVVDIPDGVTNVAPVVQAGWSIERTAGDNGVVTQVVYRADAPIENGLKAEVAMDLRFGEELADTAVPFPVTQECVEGETAWTQVAAEGEAEPESPAPIVAVGAVAEEGDGHGAAAAGDEHEHEDAAASAGSEGTAAASTTDTTAMWLGGAGLALGVVALGVALVALLRRRAS